ncbi:transketolase [Lactonifactor longoviformis]|uniref:Transketolase n=1 Tax=Lactonifactor longoviformis DSM 17459 TaxID=1122155 RepID=A0A1M4Z8I6_9CLOT|nr:transketolase [Lactonifactor longoviformis]POP33275.1 transketolase [Lactonifactor longoviformis]SHF14072.1 transketolase [Lactonifactor longoviformis DSM 17459]
MKNIGTEELKQQAKELRKTALTMIYEAQSGHPGGAFSAADLVTALYFREMNLDPENPKWEDRDRFVLSKGHVCPIQYAALGTLGFFPEKELHTLRKEGSILQGHPDMKRCPGIDISTGSLGQGLSCAVGMAIAGKMNHKDYRVFAMIGDGESDEGQIWEAIMCANRYQLDNLIVILDNNGLQLDGTTDEIMPLLDMSQKLKDFGYEVYDINGHDMDEIVCTLDEIRAGKTKKPKFINAHTVKGKGVSFMENQLGWHGAAPNEQQYAQAMEELERGDI